MFTLKFNLNADYSGCTYTLLANGVFVKRWSVTYGYETPEWQEKEQRDWTTLRSELKGMGLDYDELNLPNTPSLSPLSA